MAIGTELENPCSGLTLRLPCSPGVSDLRIDIQQPRIGAA
jgi:hypothetical protein